MADTKISALPAVAAPADGDEFATNQAGVTKKETRAQIVSTITAALATHAGLTAAGVHGSATATGANTLVHRDAVGDADATAFNAAAGAAGTPSHTFTADPNTGHYNYAADELGVATGGAHRAHWNTTGAVILNDAAASSKMTGPGVTIQQGGYDDEAIALQSTDVAHGVTDIADTDTYATLRKVEADSGGVILSGFKDADGLAGLAAVLRGILGENVDTTKTTAGRAITEVHGYIKSGTTIGDTNADGNVFGVRTRRGAADVTLLLVDEDADLHVFNDIVVAGVVDTIDVANHVHTAAAGMGPLLTAAGITDRTRKFFVPCVGGWNVTLGSALVRNFNQGWTLADANECSGFSSFLVPNDFVSDMTITPVVISAASANLRSNHSAEYGQCGENYFIHVDLVALGTTAVVTSRNSCIQQLALTNEAVGDIVHMKFTRRGDDVLDTINAAAFFPGWIVEYTADS